MQKKNLYILRSLFGKALGHYFYYHKEFEELYLLKKKRTFNLTQVEM